MSQHANLFKLTLVCTIQHQSNRLMVYDAAFHIALVTAAAQTVGRHAVGILNRDIFGLESLVLYPRNGGAICADKRPACNCGHHGPGLCINAGKLFFKLMQVV